MTVLFLFRSVASEIESNGVEHTDVGEEPQTAAATVCNESATSSAEC